MKSVIIKGIRSVGLTILAGGILLLVLPPNNLTTEQILGIVFIQSGAAVIGFLWHPGIKENQ